MYIAVSLYSQPHASHAPDRAISVHQVTKQKLPDDKPPPRQVHWEEDVDALELRSNSGKHDGVHSQTESWSG
jgi:hypothetical protein